MDHQPTYSLQLTHWNAMQPSLFEWAAGNHVGIKLTDGAVYNCQCEECLKLRAKAEALTNR